MDANMDTGWRRQEPKEPSTPTSSTIEYTDLDKWQTSMGASPDHLLKPMRRYFIWRSHCWICSFVPAEYRHVDFVIVDFYVLFQNGAFSQIVMAFLKNYPPGVMEHKPSEKWQIQIYSCK
jgi:hypothetical protein